MTPHFPAMKAKDVVKVLKKNGFLLVSQRGSHQKWRNEESNRQVIVPFHPGKDLPRGTLFSIIEGSGLRLENFIKK